MFSKRNVSAVIVLVSKLNLKIKLLRNFGLLLEYRLCSGKTVWCGLGLNHLSMTLDKSLIASESSLKALKLVWLRVSNSFRSECLVELTKHSFLDREDKKEILEDEAKGVLSIRGQLSLNYGWGGAKWQGCHRSANLRVKAKLGKQCKLDTR